MTKSLLSTLFLILIAVTGVSSNNLLAQCGGGGCGGGGCGGGGCGGGGCGGAGGGCPSGKCGGGKKVGAVPKPQGGCKSCGGGGAAVDPAKVPGWQEVSSAMLESAATEKRPIVVYFEAEDAAETVVYGEDVAKLSKDAALFVRIPYTADREKSPWAEKSVVPASRLLSDNPSYAYNIAVGKATLLVCDWHGNEFYRVAATTSATELESMLKKIPERVTDIEKKLQKNLDAADAAWKKADRAPALKAIMKNFKEGLVGLVAQNETIKLYHEIMDASRAEISTLKEKGDKAALGKLAVELKGTDAAKDAAEAVAALKS